VVEKNSIVSSRNATRTQIHQDMSWKVGRVTRALASGVWLQAR
jgi:hypothetical protein